MTKIYEVKVRLNNFVCGYKFEKDHLANHYSSSTSPPGWFTWFPPDPTCCNLISQWRIWNRSIRPFEWLDLAFGWLDLGWEYCTRWHALCAYFSQRWKWDYKCVFCLCFGATLDCLYVKLLDAYTGCNFLVVCHALPIYKWTSPHRSLAARLWEHR